MIGTMATHEAVRKAEEQGLDLVEINPKAKPPICKILDYGKFKYEKSKKEREDKKNRKGQELKEILFRPKTGEHDYEFKIKSVKKFLEEGNKVKLVIRFRGRETMHPETGKAILDRVCRDTLELATVIQIAQFEGRVMSMTLGPKPSKNRPALTKAEPSQPASE
jgi:translation initiation factor IF-3